MRFGLFFILERPPGVSDREVYERNLEQCRVADQLGFDEIWLGEHRLSPYGTMPDTMVFAGAVSQVTERIRIGTAVIVPAFSHPLRVAEQVAMIDVMSGGRFDLGVGRGYSAREFRGLGVPQSESTARFRESMAIIEGLLTQERFSYEGRFWSVEDVTLHPRPLQQPVPIYVAVAKTPESYAWTSERGYGALSGNPYSLDPGTVDGFGMYVEAERAAGRGDTGMQRIWGLTGMAFVHPDDARARELARAPLEFANRLSLENVHVSAPGEALPEDYSRYGDWLQMYEGVDYDRVLELNSTLVGSPERVVEKLTKMHSQFGFENCLLWLNRGGLMPQDEVLRSMETIAREVMPGVAHLGIGAAVRATG